MIALLSLIISLTSYSFDEGKFKVDAEEFNQEFNVKSTSGKSGSIRAYKSSKTELFDMSRDELLPLILNFEEKCNNEYKSKRKLTNPSYDCPIHNQNLIESKIIELDSKKYTFEKNEIKRFLVKRRIYNQSNYEHYDLIQIFKDKKTTSIIQTMLDDEAVKQYLEKPEKKDSVFLEARGSYILKEKGKNKTELTYTYETETDHWILNKSVSTSKMFKASAEGINLLFKSLKK